MGEEYNLDQCFDDVIDFLQVYISANLHIISGR